MGTRILTHTQLRLLRQAIDAAADWRGSMVGKAYSEAEMLEEADILAKFDARMTATYDALKIVRQQQSHLRNLAKARKLQGESK